jgi:hypothetical protein
MTGAVVGFGLIELFPTLLIRQSLSGYSLRHFSHRINQLNPINGLVDKRSTSDACEHARAIGLTVTSMPLSSESGMQGRCGDYQPMRMQNVHFQ